MKLISIMLVLWYIFPIVLLTACNFIVQTVPFFKRHSIIATDLATPFLLMSIHVISVDTYQKSAVPYVIIIILLMGVGVSLSHAYYYGDIQYERFFKTFWRIIFLVMLLAHLILIILSVFSYL
ncbi:DUF3397 domain-containing protein [Vagococcus intermedius]|uniref:DUF3397 domain-containing protein n=1 Tax=Vagococcus intermedius TaxID=2991418 RepID=A0AAF0CW87_9ENTE|nr:DUF3397 domain-containing protein [Vagococcus intermedius]WEG73852.1 DUF3397 domain-containing protein [Vagococcus intermedius]WEG75937.1 DUF3397 domain-containing protein [Vagococcus intermedius]